MQYAQRRSPGSNAVGIGLVVALHLGVVYALITGLGTVIRPAPPLVTKATVLYEPEKQAEQPREQEFKVKPPDTPVLLIKPDIPVQQKVETPPIAVGTFDAPKDMQVAVVAPPSAAPAQPDALAGARRLAGPPLLYPHRMAMEGIEGWVDVQCDVDEYGGTSNCVMIDHDGPLAFVEASLDFVRATRYSPATRNGVAVPEKGHSFHIAFKIPK